MLRLMEVLRRVPVLRIVAAADVAALHAEPQMHPVVAHREALLAALGARLDVPIDSGEMRARGLIGLVFSGSHDPVVPQRASRRHGARSLAPVRVAQPSSADLSLVSAAQCEMIGRIRRFRHPPRGPMRQLNRVRGVMSVLVLSTVSPLLSTSAAQVVVGAVGPPVPATKVFAAADPRTPIDSAHTPGD